MSEALLPAAVAGTLVLGLLAGGVAGLRIAGRRNRQREERSNLCRQAMESFPNGAVLIFDRRLRHALAAGRLGEMGLSSEAVEGRTLQEAFPGLYMILEPAYRAALDGHESTFELPYADRDYLVRVTPVRDQTGRVTAGMAMTQDLTDRKRREHRLTELASRDVLTGAWNRRRLLEELEWVLSGVARRRTGEGSLLLLDLDGFKGVNDTLGHEAGDELLRAVARAVEGCVRRTDVVARHGGDEFAVLLPNTSTEQARRVGEKVSAAVDAVWPMACAGGASLGIAEVGGENWTAASVLERADRAMYRKKRAGRLRAAS